MDDFIERALGVKNLVRWLVGWGVALIIVFGIIWWNAVYENPYNVYWGMLANSLATSNVTKHIEQKSSQATLDQYVSLNYGVRNFAYGRTTLKDQLSTVKTESIGTMSNDFIRYTGIETAQKGRNGKPLDFTALLGKWAKAPAVNSAAQTGSAPFFIQTVLGLAGGNTVPIVNLPVQQRGELLQMLHSTDVYKTTYDNVSKKTVNGRLLYTYDVSVEPVGYVAFEKQVAQDLGIKTISTLDPNSYQNQSPIKLKFVVDAHSHRLASIIYPQTSHTETYSAYGIPTRVPVPMKTISDTKLQQLLANPQ